MPSHWSRVGARLPETLYSISVLQPYREMGRFALYIKTLR